MGDRVGQTVNGVTTHFALDVHGLPEVIYTSDGAAYLHLPGVTLTEKGGETRYLLSDGLGSVRHVTDEAGVVVSTQAFDPYGNPLASGGEPYGYTGEWWQEDVGLLHLRARWYDPASGTFLSVDPVESEPPYQYVRGNVVNLVDPSGNAPNCEDGCKPSTQGYYLLDKARISCLDIKTHGGSTLEYLEWEANNDPAALLTRVAMGENHHKGYHNDRVYVMWIIRLRMEIGYSTNGADETTSLKDEAFHPYQFSSLTGYAPLEIEGMIHVTDPYEAAKGNSEVAESQCGGNRNAGIYPCNKVSNPDAPLAESQTARDWIVTYFAAQRILQTTSAQFIEKFPQELRGYESFRASSATSGHQFFQPYGNKYRNDTNLDLDEFGWAPK